MVTEVTGQAVKKLEISNGAEFFGDKGFGLQATQLELAYRIYWATVQERRENGGGRISLGTAKGRERSAQRVNQRRNSFSPFAGGEAEMGILFERKKEGRK